MNYFFKKIGQLESVDIYKGKNNSLILFLVVPALIVYSYLINNYGNETIRIDGVRGVFALLFVSISILPYIFKKTLKYFYGWCVF